LYNTQPKLIVEILSETSERYDRAEKFHYYRMLASLEEYVLIAQDVPRVECYRRKQNWDFQLYQHEDSAVFAAIDLILPLAAIYEGVVFTSSSQR